MLSLKFVCSRLVASFSRYGIFLDIKEVTKYHFIGRNHIVLLLKFKRKKESKRSLIYYFIRIYFIESLSIFFFLKYFYYFNISIFSLIKFDIISKQYFSHNNIWCFDFYFQFYYFYLMKIKLIIIYNNLS